MTKKDGTRAVQSEQSFNRLALSGHAIAVPALLIGGYPQVRDKFSPRELAMQMAKTESE
jgi:hypothetical protein